MNGGTESDNEGKETIYDNDVENQQLKIAEVIGSLDDEEEEDEDEIYAKCENIFDKKTVIVAQNNTLVTVLIVLASS